MTYGEAVRHATTLSLDPSSQVAAAVRDWRHSISREALFLLDLYDLTHSANTTKTVEPHPGRPFDPAPRSGVSRGNAGGRTPEQVIEILRAHGHD